MLEQVLQEHSALIAKNNALLEQLIGALSPLSVPMATDAPSPATDKAIATEAKKAAKTNKESKAEEDKRFGQPHHGHEPAKAEWKTPTGSVASEPAPVVTLADVQNALIDLADKKGRPKAREVLAQFKANKIGDLSAEQYSPVIAACSETLKAA